MMMDDLRQPSVTLSDVLRLALPLSTAVVGGQNRRAINWVVVLSKWGDWAGQVNAGDLLLVPPALQEQMPEAKMAAGVAELAALSISGAILFSAPSEAMIAAANEAELPLLVITEGSDVRNAHRNIATLLVDRQAQMAERGMQLYRRLSEMSREGQGLEAMTGVMARLTGKLVVVQDKRLEIQAFGSPFERGQQSAQSATPRMSGPIALEALDLEALKEALGQRENLPPLLRNRKAAAQTRQSHWQQLLPVGNLARLVSPIVVGDRARGYLSVIGPPDQLDVLDSLTAEHGAAACALEMAKAKAVSEAKKALRGDFLEGLLAGQLARQEIARLTARLDHDTDLPHAVLALTWDRRANVVPSLRRLETTANWLISTSNRPALVHIFGDDHVYIFQALRDELDMNTAHQLARRLNDQIGNEYPDAALIGGMAGPLLSLADWRSGHQEALKAMELARRLGLRQIVELDNLGVYQLLGQLESVPAVQAFCEEMIGPLARYDAQHNSALVHTLTAYFQHHGNVTQTADSLYIHRNTLLYRLERIQELTGKDLDQPDMRLAFHLALKVWHLRPADPLVQITQ